MIVVPVLMTSCQVSDQPKSGPVAAQRRTTAQATTNAHGEPTQRSTLRASDSNMCGSPMNRRSLLAGIASLLVAPAIVRAVNLMPIASFVEEELVYGIRIQSWPFSEERPHFHISGIMLRPSGVPLSHFNDDIARFRTLWPRLVYRPIMSFP